MTHVTYIEPSGNEVIIDVEDGLSVMQAAMQEGIEGIEAQCGGACSCATCHCYVDQAWIEKLPPPSMDEQVMLANVAADRLPNSRLSCQLQIEPALDGLIVRFPDRQS